MEQVKINQEYERLHSLFKEVDENKAKLIDELLWKAAFLKVELDNLEATVKKGGALQKSNKGNIRLNPTYKTFLNTLTVYQGIIKTLNSVLGKNELDENDEFDEFLRNANQ
ncbi:MAG: hypothetical protein LKG11_02750 [Bacilli bacterium]|jgi:hypothetical protein|nr:hypothetical protein [Bacilli bacterium]